MVAQAEDAALLEPPDQRLRRPIGRLARNVGFLGASQVLTWALAVVYTLVVARLLGPAGMGVLVIGWSVAGIAEGVAGLGSRPLIVKTIAREPSRGPALIGTAIVVRAGLLVPCTVAAYAYVVLGRFTAQETLVIWLSMGVALGFLVQEAIQSGLQAIERMEFLAITDVINKSLLTFVSIPLALLGRGPVWLMGVNVAVMGVCVVLNLIWVRQIGIEWSLNLKRARDFVAESLAYWAFALFYTIYLWIDSALLALFGAPQEVGWYGVSTKLFQTLMFVPVILSTAWLPRLAAAYKLGPVALKSESELPIQLIGTLAMPIAVGTAMVAGPLVVTLYGPSFAAANPVLAVLAITAIPTYLNIILSQILMAADKQATWTKILVVASIANPALNIALIPYFHEHFGNGALGAALCMLITELIVVLIGGWAARSYLSVGIASRFLRAGFVTVVMAGAALLIAPLGPAAQIGVSVMVFAALLGPARLVQRQELGELDRLGRSIPLIRRLLVMARLTGAAR